MKTTWLKLAHWHKNHTFLMVLLLGSLPVSNVKGEELLVSESLVIPNNGNTKGNGLIVGNSNTYSDYHGTLVGFGNQAKGKLSDVKELGGGIEGDFGILNIVGDYNKIEGNGNVLGSHSSLKGNAVTSIGDRTKIEGNKAIAIGDKSSVVADNAVSIGVGSSNNRDNSVSFGNDKNKKQLTNVAAGTEDTDAVNVKQLNQKAQAAIDSANRYTDGKIIDTKNELNTNINNAKDEAINTSNSYTNKKHEESLNHAKEVADKAEKSANQYTDNRFNQLNNQTNQRINQLDNKIDRVEKRMNAGIAGVTAIASIPYSTSENFSFGMGVGHYQNGKAIAAGAQYKIADNANVRMNIAWDNTDNASVGAGLAIGW